MPKVHTPTGAIRFSHYQLIAIDGPVRTADLLLALGVTNPAMGTGGNASGQPNGPGVTLQFTYPTGVGGSSEQQGALIPTRKRDAIRWSLLFSGWGQQCGRLRVTGGPFPIRMRCRNSEC